MAWETLKAYIDDKIRDKLPAKISADNDHNPTLNEIVDVFGQDYIYSGITGKTLQPINDDNNRMYFTDGSVGDYLFFKDELGAVLSVEGGEFVIFTGVDNVWVKRTIYNNGTFLTLPDTPSSYAGEAGSEVRVNDTGTAIEFVDTPKFTESKDTELTDATTDIAAIKLKTDNISTSGDGIGVSSMFAGDGEYDNSTTIDDEGFPTFWGTAQNYQSEYQKLDQAISFKTVFTPPTGENPYPEVLTTYGSGIEKGEEGINEIKTFTEEEWINFGYQNIFNTRSLVSGRLSTLFKDEQLSSYDTKEMKDINSARDAINDYF